MLSWICSNNIAEKFNIGWTLERRTSLYERLKLIHTDLSSCKTVGLIVIILHHYSYHLVIDTPASTLNLSNGQMCILWGMLSLNVESLLDWSVIFNCKELTISIWWYVQHCSSCSFMLLVRKIYCSIYEPSLVVCCRFWAGLREIPSEIPSSKKF